MQKMHVSVFLQLPLCFCSLPLAPHAFLGSCARCYGNITLGSRFQGKCKKGSTIINCINLENCLIIYLLLDSPILMVFIIYLCIYHIAVSLVISVLFLWNGGAVLWIQQWITWFLCVTRTDGGPALSHLLLLKYIFILLVNVKLSLLNPIYSCLDLLWIGLHTTRPLWMNSHIGNSLDTRL